MAKLEDYAAVAWETYAAYALAHQDDPDGWDGIEAMRRALRCVDAIRNGEE